jgi:polar amino acid transport system substrate-binding protein
MIRLALVFLVFGFGMLFSVALYAESAAVTEDHRPVLKAGFVEFPPFKYADEDGNASGPWVEMTEKVAAEAGYQVDWVHLPIARVYLYLKIGKIDFWPGVAGIPQIKNAVYESSVTPMRVVLYAFHQRHVKPLESLESLEDKPLILINGFTYLGALRHLSLDDDDLSYAPDHESALRMLELGRGQYVLDYDEPIQAVKHEFPALDLIGTPIFKARGAFIVSRSNPDAKTIVKQFDDAYDRLVKSGQLAPLQ